MIGSGRATNCSRRQMVPYAILPHWHVRWTVALLGKIWKWHRIHGQTNTLHNSIQLAILLLIRFSCNYFSLFHLFYAVMLSTYRVYLRVFRCMKHILNRSTWIWTPKAYKFPFLRLFEKCSAAGGAAAMHIEQRNQRMIRRVRAPGLKRVTNEWNGTR